MKPPLTVEAKVAVELRDWLASQLEQLEAFNINQYAHHVVTILLHEDPELEDEPLCSQDLLHDFHDLRNKKKHKTSKKAIVQFIRRDLYYEEEPSEDLIENIVDELLLKTEATKRAMTTKKPSPQKRSTGLLTPISINVDCKVKDQNPGTALSDGKDEKRRYMEAFPSLSGQASKEMPKQTIWNKENTQTKDMGITAAASQKNTAENQADCKAKAVPNGGALHPPGQTTNGGNAAFKNSPSTARGDVSTVPPVVMVPEGKIPDSETVKELYGIMNSGALWKPSPFQPLKGGDEFWPKVTNSGSGPSCITAVHGKKFAAAAMETEHALICEAPEDQSLTADEEVEAILSSSVEEGSCKAFGRRQAWGSCPYPPYEPGNKNTVSRLAQLTDVAARLALPDDNECQCSCQHVSSPKATKLDQTRAKEALQKHRDEFASTETHIDNKVDDFGIDCVAQEKGVIGTRPEDVAMGSEPKFEVDEDKRGQSQLGSASGAHKEIKELLLFTDCWNIEESLLDGEPLEALEQDTVGDEPFSLFDKILVSPGKSANKDEATWTGDKDQAMWSNFPLKQNCLDSIREELFSSSCVPTPVARPASPRASVSLMSPPKAKDNAKDILESTFINLLFGTSFANMDASYSSPFVTVPGSISCDQLETMFFQDQLPAPMPASAPGTGSEIPGITCSRWLEGQCSLGQLCPFSHPRLS